MCSRLSDEVSSCSTSISFCPYYEDYFFVGTQERSENLAIVQLTEEKLFYENKRLKKSLTLSLATIEESIYLRDERSNPHPYFSGFRNKIKALSINCNSFYFLKTQIYSTLPPSLQSVHFDRVRKALSGR